MIQFSNCYYDPLLSYLSAQLLVHNFQGETLINHNKSLTNTKNPWLHTHPLKSKERRERKKRLKNVLHHISVITLSSHSVSCISYSFCSVINIMCDCRKSQLLSAPWLLRKLQFFQKIEISTITPCYQKQALKEQMITLSNNKTEKQRNKRTNKQKISQSHCVTGLFHRRQCADMTIVLQHCAVPFWVYALQCPSPAQ